MATLVSELSLSAQTSYAEIFDQVRALDLDSLAGIVGSFQRRTIKGRDYVYFGYRDPIDGAQRRSYVGPADSRVEALIQRFKEQKAPRRFAPNAQAAIALGCGGVLPKHYRIIRQLWAYGFFRAGGVLIGTHAFVCIANMLGVRWAAASSTLDVDLAHAARNVSIALPADVRLSVHDALTSLEMGLLPIQELSRKIGPQYRNPKDSELRIDFLTTLTRSKSPVRLTELDLVLEPMKFMDYLLEDTTQAALLSREGACLINVPSPARFGIHKLIVAGERPPAERVKARKDLQQVAALAQWHLVRAQTGTFRAAFLDAASRGRGWRSRLARARRGLLDEHPELNDAALWERAAPRRR